MNARKWWLVGGAIVVAVVVLVGGGVVVGRMIWGPSLNVTVNGKAPAPSLLSPLPRSAPQYRWHLARPKVETFLKRHINGDGDDMYVGAFGDHAFFATKGRVEGRAELSTVVYGVNVTSGQLVASPQVLDGYSTTCLRNGLSVLCLDTDAQRATVLDPATGAVTHSGPTTLPTLGLTSLAQEGEYAVLRQEGVGWSGIGPAGELTWTVPGNGGYLFANSSPTLPSPLIRRGSAVDDKAPDVLFSVVDGKVLGQTRDSFANVYRSGYFGQGADDRSLRFYDADGRELNSVTVPETYRLRSESTYVSEVGIGSLTGVDRKGGRWLLFDDRGRVFANLPRPERPEDSVGVVGGRLLTWDARGKGLQEFDIRTGEPLKHCDGISLSNVVGTDGSIYVVRTAENVDAVPGAAAFDVNTCRQVWSFDTDRVVAVGDTLLRVTADEIAAIRAA